MTTKDILRTSLDLQALALARKNIVEAKRKKPKLTKMAINNIVGASLIKTQAQLVNSL